jgi:hypothetical protein
MFFAFTFLPIILSTRSLLYTPPIHRTRLVHQPAPSLTEYNTAVVYQHSQPFHSNEQLSTPKNGKHLSDLHIPTSPPYI